jgi:site-specific DNA-cytosine methylase
MPFMIDLCCGLKGASQSFKDAGWDVLTLDIKEKFEPDIVADVREWFWEGVRPDLIWISDPCTEFARESMPWSRKGITPDLSILEGCLRIVDRAKPRFWVRENVKGSIKWVAPLLGPPRLIKLPYVFWGFFPMPVFNLRGVKKKESYGSNQSALRSQIPLAVSNGFRSAIEQQAVLF